MYPLQLIRLTKNKGGNLWINPEQIIYVDQGEEKTEGEKKPGKPQMITIIHTSSKDLFVKEPPDEINKILRSMKRETKIQQIISH